jgi:hypothetical protein
VKAPPLPKTFETSVTIEVLKTMATAKADPLNIALVNVLMHDYGVWEPKPSQFEGAAKHTARFVLDKSNPDHVKIADEVKAAEEAALADKFPKGAPAGVRYCLVDGDEVDGRGNRLHPDHFAGTWFITAKNAQRPQIYIGKEKRPCTPDDAANIVHSGNIVSAGIRLFSYDNIGKGVSAALNVVWVLRKGTRIGGGSQQSEELVTSATDDSLFDDSLSSPLSELL